MVSKDAAQRLLLLIRIVTVVKTRSNQYWLLPNSVKQYLSKNWENAS